MNIETLYPLVSEAIHRAEGLEDRGDPGVRAAYLRVSILEEMVAEVVPASDPEGAVARRGAVRAALEAGEPARAQYLAERFLSETDVEDELRTYLRLSSERAESEREQDVAPRSKRAEAASAAPPRRELRRT